MFQRIRRLFKRDSSRSNVFQPPSSPPPRQPEPAEPTPAVPSNKRTGSAVAGSSPLPASAPAAAPVSEAAGSVTVSLKGVVGKLPDTLKVRVRQAGSSSTKIPFPLAKVLSQLASGRIQVTFGELRRAAPPGVFSDAPDQDGKVVELPLHEILPQLKPDQLPRRSTQKRVEIPDEVTDVFGHKGKLSPSVRLAPKDSKPIQASPAAAPAPPARKPNQPPTAIPIAPSGRPATPVVPSPRVKPKAPLPPSKPVTPAQPAKPSTAIAPKGLPQPTSRSAKPTPAPAAPPSQPSKETGSPQTPPLEGIDPG